MNIVSKTSNCIFKSDRLSLRYFEFVSKLFGIRFSQNIENQQITSAKNTILMILVRQYERKKAFRGRRRTKSNIHDKDVWLHSRYCSYNLIAS